MPQRVLYRVLCRVILVLGAALPGLVGCGSAQDTQREGICIPGQVRITGDDECHERCDCQANFQWRCRVTPCAFRAPPKVDAGPLDAGLVDVPLRSRVEVGVSTTACGPRP